MEKLKSMMISELLDFVIYNELERNDKIMINSFVADILIATNRNEFYTILDKLEKFFVVDTLDKIICDYFHGNINEITEYRKIAINFVKEFYRKNNKVLIRTTNNTYNYYLDCFISAINSSYTFERINKFVSKAIAL